MLTLLFLGAVALALVKPWGAQPVADSILAAPPPAPGVTSSAAGLSLGTRALPPAAFAPSPEACLADMGWRACALEPSGAQAVRSTYISGKAPIAAGLEGPVIPAVVFVTKAGAALAFYGPPGFYTASKRHADNAGGEPAWGSVAVSAWWLDTDGGSRFIDLSPVGPLGSGQHVVGNAFVPPADALLNADHWPEGRYVVWFQGGGDKPWDAFFDFEILPAD